VSLNFENGQAAVRHGPDAAHGREKRDERADYTCTFLHAAKTGNLGTGRVWAVHTPRSVHLDPRAEIRGITSQMTKAACLCGAIGEKSLEEDTLEVEVSPGWASAAPAVPAAGPGRVDWHRRHGAIMRAWCRWQELDWVAGQG